MPIFQNQIKYSFHNKGGWIKSNRYGLEWGDNSANPYLENQYIYKKTLKLGKYRIYFYNKWTEFETAPHLYRQRDLFPTIYVYKSNHSYAYGIRWTHEGYHSLSIDFWKYSIAIYKDSSVYHQPPVGPVPNQFWGWKTIKDWFHKYLKENEELKRQLEKIQEANVGLSDALTKLNIELNDIKSKFLT